METGTAALQHDVQRELGSCMLAFQEYERLLKQLVVAGELSGALADLPAALARRQDKFRKKSLGELVGAFTGRQAILTSTEESPAANAQPEPEQVDASWMAMRWNIVMAPDKHARVVAQLGELVDMRNVLVHHFIEHFDLATADGCAAALHHLAACHATIALHRRDLNGWTASMRHSRALALSVWESTAIDDLFLHCDSDEGDVE